MRATFTKADFNSEAINEKQYIKMFADMGFNAKKVEICFKNGCSAYIYLNVRVVNENKMYADVFVMDGKANIKVRVSDHASNLEMICGGVSNNTLSFEAFKNLAENNVIANIN